MSNGSGDGDGVDEDVPEAVMDWLSSVAAQRGMSETELLQTLLAGVEPDADTGEFSQSELSRLEREVHTLIEDVRERVIQVKRETDEKAPSDHTHHNLRNTMEQLGREVGALEADLDRLDERLDMGFENYEEILRYLTETTDELNRRLGRLASAVIDLRERMGEAARDEARRTALAHLTETANRSGVDTAKCEVCGEAVDISLLIEPRCPHCDSSFSTLEPKTGFFRSSVLHTGTLPALESADEGSASAVGLEDIVVDSEADAGGAPDVQGVPEASPAAEEPEPASDASSVEEPAEDAHAPESTPAGEKADGAGDLEDIHGIGPTYADRLQAAGIDGPRALATVDPEELSEAIGVSASRIADWVAEADDLVQAT